MEDSLMEKRIDKLEARDTKNTEDIIRIDERLNGVGINLDNLKKDRDDVENLIKEEENGRNKASNCSKKRP